MSCNWLMQLCSMDRMASIGSSCEYGRKYMGMALKARQIGMGILYAKQLNSHYEKTNEKASV